MATIAYNSLSDYLSRTTAAEWPAVTLICGEEVLFQKACEAVVDTVLPEAERALGIEVFDGAEDSIGAVLASLNTYALLSGTKVVLLREARLFYSAKTNEGLRDKMAQAARSGEMKKASRPFLNLMAQSGLTFADLTTPALRGKLADDVDGQAPAWLAQLIDYCRDNGLRIPEKRDDADLLKKAMDKGFPDGHRLVITTDLVDRRKALFKTIDEAGLVIDCSVPKGETRADRMAQDAVMQAAVDDALAQAGKKMAADARQRLMQWTGFDLRTLGANLEKLISYVGQRQTIGDADVTAVLQRTRKDPIFEFTNAIAEQDLSAALFFMKNLLEDDMHPLQLLMAIANQLRRLILAKDFIVRDQGRSWSSHLSFPQFKSASIKAVQTDDEAHEALMAQWDSILDPDKAGKKRSKAVVGDLVLAKNPKSPFPVFQTLKKADAFALEALTRAIIDLSETDLRMKSTGQDHRMLLESFLIRLMR